jgi:hypothetical protein
LGDSSPLLSREKLALGLERFAVAGRSLWT